jgi:hypothetical protein
MARPGFTLANFISRLARAENFRIWDNAFFSKDKTGAREPRVPANATVLEN